MENVMDKSTLQCPTCREEVKSEEGSVCLVCAVKYHKAPFCPECYDPLERLKACGNVSYYCNGCRMQKSRSTIKWRLVAKE